MAINRDGSEEEIRLQVQVTLELVSDFLVRSGLFTGVQSIEAIIRKVIQGINFPVIIKVLDRS